MGSCYSSKAIQMSQLPESKVLNSPSKLKSSKATSSKSKGLNAFGFQSKVYNSNNTKLQSTKKQDNDVEALSVSGAGDAPPTQEITSHSKVSPIATKFGFKKSYSKKSALKKSNATVTKSNKELTDRTQNTTEYARKQCDEINANIPKQLTNTSDTLQNHDLIRKGNSLEDINGNNSEALLATLSAPSQNTSSGKSVKTRNGKFHTNILRRPFVKSKTFSGPHENSLKQKSDPTIKQSASKDSVSPTKSVTSPDSNSKTPLSYRRSFLNFFSKQSHRSKCDDKSSESSSNSPLRDNIHERAFKETREQVSSESGSEVFIDCKNQIELSPTSEISKSSSVSLVKEPIVPSKAKNEAKTKNSSEETKDRVKATIAEDLKEKLNEVHVCKGKAPIAMIDSIETTSIGSVNSDDLMLDMDVDLGPFDDQDDEFAHSTSSFSSENKKQKTNSSHVIRVRSRSNSSRGRSKSHEKNVSNISPVQELQTLQSSSDSGYTEKQSRSQLDSGPGAVRKSVQTFHDMSEAERRDKWHQPKTNDDQAQSNEHSEGLNLSSSEQRKYGSTDKPAIRPMSLLPSSTPCQGKATSSSSNIPKHEAVSSDALSHSMTTTPSAGGTVLRPPRTSSVTDDERMNLDGFTYRQMSQDLNALKTMLFKLKRVMQDDELSSPMTTPNYKNGLSFGSSQPSSPFAKFGDTNLASYLADNALKDKEQQTNLENVVKENEELRREVQLLKQEVEEKDKTIKLLQHQMAKYEHCETFDASSHDKKSPPSTEQSKQTNNRKTAKKSLQYSTVKRSGNRPITAANSSTRSLPKASLQHSDAIIQKVQSDVSTESIVSKDDIAGEHSHEIKMKDSNATKRSNPKLPTAVKQKVIADKADVLHTKPQRKMEFPKKYHSTSSIIRQNTVQLEENVDPNIPIVNRENFSNTQQAYPKNLYSTKVNNDSVNSTSISHSHFRKPQLNAEFHSGLPQYAGNRAVNGTNTKSQGSKLPTFGFSKRTPATNT